MAPGLAIDEAFQYPPEHDFPPFYTLQPNALTKRAQLQQWSTIIQGFCRHNHLFMLSLADALETPLFRNRDLGKRLGMADTKEVLDWMSGKEGGERIEWMGTAHETCWVYWRRPEEWASVLAEWVGESFAPWIEVGW
jgi:ESCRT-II complex subunit VPS25